jgi:chromosome segregation protein
MRLVSVTLAGFKSFADRTDVKVLPGITAIVGPNGCGKTNIADALRWALGEQSPKALRGHRMDDVIFHGSASRRPVGLAEAVLTFSNDGEVAVPWSEVSVGRRLYRDGESEYLLNKTACRLKDIHDLFLGTGVNPKAYALMEQERLAQILTAKPLDRRVFVEEAAGITRYKQQRTETLAKLEATRQNLLRVRDVMDEVRRQLGSLERQARKAQQYKVLQAERRALDLLLAAAEHAALVAEEEALAAREQAERDRLEGCRTRVAALGAEQEAVRAEALAAEHGAADLRTAWQRAELTLEGCLTRAAQLQAAERDLAEEIARLAAEGGALRARLDALDRERAARQDALLTLRGDFAGRRERAAEAEGALETLRRDLRASREASERRRAEQVALAGRRTELGQALGAAGERREQLRRRRERVAAELQQAEAEAGRCAEARAEVGQRLAAATARVGALEAELRRLGARTAEAAAARAAAGEAAERARIDLAARRSSLAALEELEAQRAGYGRGVQTVFAAAREGGLGGVVGSVADLLDVPPELERAVEAALGERLEWVVMETFAAAKDALGHLAGHGGGQATFLPLDWLNGAAPASVPGEPAVVGVASRMVGSKYPALVGNLLGSVVVVEDLGAAERLWSGNGHGTSYVTVEGEVLGPPGALGGGRAAAAGDGSLLARKRAIRELGSAVAALERDLAGAAAAVERADAELAGLGAEQRAAATSREAAEAGRVGLAKDLEQVERDAERAALFARTCAVELVQVDGERAAADAEDARLGAELADVERAVAGAAADVGRLLAEIAAAAAEEAERAQAFLDAQVELAGLAGRIQTAESDLERMAAEAREARERLLAGDERARTLAGRAAEGRAERESLERGAVEAREARDRAQAASQEASEALAALHDRLRACGEALREAEGEQARGTQGLHAVSLRLAEVRVRRQDGEADAGRRLDVDVEGLRAAHDPTRDAEAARVRREAVAARIAALEPVNLVADEEYRELDERLGFLRTQHDDLTASMKDLERALRGMTRTAQERFEEAFAAISRNFQELFARLFEGGRAELRLVESPEGGDPLETGIEMVAQPRGKRLQAISLLSGGEKALTGLALLFAIFYYRPSPFCLLDEVDAPLDDANIHRFTRVLRELSTQTQFLVITHNRKTMEAADALYGVTMEEPGLSRLVSVNLA